jgi:hypothetical protein
MRAETHGGRLKSIHYYYHPILTNFGMCRQILVGYISTISRLMKIR